MAFKISLKRAVILLFSLSITMILSACMDPVDIQVFMNDTQVQTVIASTKETVYVSGDSDAGLTGGYGIISGLKSDKYYMVVNEADENNAVIKINEYPKFVTEYTNGGSTNFTPGQLISNDLLEYITRIARGKITTLTNKHTYTVKSAENFPSSTSFSYSDGGASHSIAVTDGAITIPAPTGNLTLVGLNTAYNGYQVMAVAVPPATLTNFDGKKTISNTTTSFPLEAAGSTVDYVFFNKSPLDFKVLTVKINSDSEPVDPNEPATVTDVTVTPASATVAKGGTKTFSATVNGTNNPPQTVTWTIEGANAQETTITGGVLNVAAGETAESLTIKATSTVDTSKSGTATVIVSTETATVTNVNVTPASMNVAKGNTQQFNATVTGTNSPEQAVTWSIDGTPAGGSSISTDGLLTVAAGETTSPLTIRAKSVLDPTQSGTATVTVVNCEISLDKTGTQIFDAANYNYGAQGPLTVTVTNSDKGASGALTVNLSDTNRFELSTTSIPSIAAGAYTTFTVVPKTGLAADTTSTPGTTYTATVTVSGSNGIVSQTFTVRFTVNPAVITINDIPGVTAPVMGATPVTVLTGNDQYSGTVSWEGTLVGGNFGPSTVYTAKIALTAKTNYTLDGVGVNFFEVAGTSSHATNAANSGAVTAVFPATAAAPPAPGSNPFNITFTFTDEGDGMTITPSINTISRGNFATGSSVTITLSGTWDTVRWSVDGISDTVVDSHTTSNMLTITNAQDFWPALAGNTLTITLRSAVKGGVNYSPNHPNNRVTINVTN